MYVKEEFLQLDEIKSLQASNKRRGEGSYDLFQRAIHAVPTRTTTSPT